jgi:hypothetical protein
MLKEFAGIQDSELGGISNMEQRALETIGHIAYQRFEDGCIWGSLVMTELLNEQRDRDPSGELAAEKQIMPLIRKIVHKAGFGEFVVHPTVFNPNEDHWVKQYTWTTTQEQARRFKSWHHGNDHNRDRDEWRF